MAGTTGPELRAYLHRLLTSRACTEKEARDRLLAKGASHQEAKTLIEEFRDMGFLDDAAYARLFVEGHEHWGAARVRYALRSRGVDGKIIAEALLGCDELERARPLVEEWAAQGLEWPKILARLTARGFDFRTLRTLRREFEEYEE